MIQMRHLNWHNSIINFSITDSIMICESTIFLHVLIIIIITIIITLLLTLGIFTPEGIKKIKK